MPDFDFRKTLGGKVELPHDEKLADGVDKGGNVAGLHAHMLEAAGSEPLVAHVSNLLIVNANANNVCIPALCALVVAYIAQTARDHIPGPAGEFQRKHVIDEVAAIVDDLRADRR